MWRIIVAFKNYIITEMGGSKAKPNKYKYILFDWDGCLANSLPIWFECFQKVFKRLNIIMSDEDILSITTYNTKKPTDFGVSKEVFDKLIREEAKVFMPRVKLHYGVKATLKELKSTNRKIALVTSSYKNTVIPMLRQHGIYEHFDAVITADDVQNKKPNPEGHIKALELLNGEISKAIVIGDTSGDIRAGKSLNIHTVLYAPPINYFFHDVKAFHSFKPTYVVPSFKELKKIII